MQYFNTATPVEYIMSTAPGMSPWWVDCWTRTCAFNVCDRLRSYATSVDHLVTEDEAREVCADLLAAGRESFHAAYDARTLVGPGVRMNSDGTQVHHWEIDLAAWIAASQDDREACLAQFPRVHAPRRGDSVHAPEMYRGYHQFSSLRAALGRRGATLP